ncbi:MAG TPA: NAD(P)-dependent oxidoreductase [Acidimicrobiia bacterium]
MKRIVVTGGSGKLGTAVVQRLLEHGYRVVNVDRVPGEGSAAQFVHTDLTDYGQVVEVMAAVDDRYEGVDAVVHLAAIPAPGLVTNSRTFMNNMTASYNVFTAARASGITDLVWASSETLLGLPFDNPPPYVPVDEEYPARPETTYAMVKHLEETMAAQMCRRDPALKMIGLRFSNVMSIADYARFPEFQDDPRARAWNLWGYIDRRDGAQAVQLALEHQSTGMDVFIVANQDTVMQRPNAELLAEVYPEVPTRRPFEPNETLLSIDKARRVLGYDPEHSWRHHV